MSVCRLHAIAVTALAALALLARRADAAPEDDLPRPLDESTAVRLAVSRSDAVRAASAGAQAARAMGDAETRLPDPEIMAEAWQVPLSRPLALGDASMVSVSVRQTFPAPGVRPARQVAREAEARVAEAGGKDRSRLVARDAGHAFVDLQAAQAKRASHVQHRDVAVRLVTVARARLGSGAGRLTDVTEAELERARLDADVAVEDAMVRRATARLNGMLRRPIDAAIEPVPLGPPETVTQRPEKIATLLEGSRADLTSARARKEGEEAAKEASSREAAIPSFTVGAGWFAPTTLMPFHGYGVTVGATLPWIWGGARARAEASAAGARAAGYELSELRAQLRTETAVALAEVQAAAERVAVLRAKAKPAADAALETALVAYQSGQGDAMAVFRAEKEVVEVDVAIVDARTMLAHALVDLDASAGTRVPRVPLDTSAAAEAASHDHGGGK